ncbi:MAG: NUDIX domain-containing protein, partial [Desulfobacterales bacterium]|nr:NUDIX domain-containing protein [Desulfobacterales bacterium]
MTPLNTNAHRFRFCPACGKACLAPDSEKSFLCPACGFLLFINCAAAAMGLIFDHRQRLLLTRRAEDPARGTLDLPSGFAEPGEGIEQAL